MVTGLNAANHHLVWRRWASEAMLNQDTCGETCAGQCDHVVMVCKEQDLTSLRNRRQSSKGRLRACAVKAEKQVVCDEWQRFVARVVLLDNRQTQGEIERIDSAIAQCADFKASSRFMLRDEYSLVMVIDIGAEPGIRAIRQLREQRLRTA